MHAPHTGCLWLASVIAKKYTFAHQLCKAATRGQHESFSAMLTLVLLLLPILDHPNHKSTCGSLGVN